MKFIKKVCGKFLFCTRAVDPTYCAQSAPLHHNQPHLQWILWHKQNNFLTT
ncbi:hypothetical protein ACHAW6_001123 [Cyclotella cf. meneghiniana]